MTRNRQQERAVVAQERRAWRSGQWGIWRRTALAAGIPGGNGWCREIVAVHANELYVVLERPLSTAWGRVIHLAIRTASNLEPPWRDKQRIKNELFGEECTAIEVMPPAPELVDQADMYHMWVLPPEAPLPFSLHDARHEDPAHNQEDAA